MLEIKGLNVSLDGKKLLSDINLNITHGARHLLSGHNGSEAHDRYHSRKIDSAVSAHH